LYLNSINLQKQSKSSNTISKKISVTSLAKKTFRSQLQSYWPFHSRWKNVDLILKYSFASKVSLSSTRWLDWFLRWSTHTHLSFWLVGSVPMRNVQRHVGSNKNGIVFIHFCKIAFEGLQTHFMNGADRNTSCVELNYVALFYAVCFPSWWCTFTSPPFYMVIVKKNCITRI